MCEENIIATKKLSDKKIFYSNEYSHNTSDDQENLDVDDIILMALEDQGIDE